jgi:hypothetical protein
MSNDKETLTLIMISIAHVDGIEQREVELIESYVTSHFDGSTKANLLNQLHSPQENYLDLFKGIESFQQRGHILDL